MKVCVYTICKNEIDNINQWLDCMNEADYMVVVDTGSADGTYEKLREAQRKYRNLFVYKEKINPFRFDVARNVAKSHIPADTDICVSMDMDEIFYAKGWSKYLKKKWLPNHELGTLIYIDNKEDTVYNKRTVFPRTKIHTLKAVWKYPLHEMPVLNINDENSEDSVNAENHLEAYMLDLRENGWESLIVIHKSKSTSKELYVKLAELRLQEFNNIYSETIKISELFKNKYYQMCYDYINDILNKHKDENTLEMQSYKSLIYFFKGYIEKCYLKDLSLSMESFEKSVYYNARNEKSIYELIKIYNARNLNNKIINLLNPFINNYYNTRFSRYTKKYDELSKWFYEQFNHYYNISK